MKYIFPIIVLSLITFPLLSQTNLNDNYYFTRIGVHSINEINWGYGFRFENNTLFETSFGINLGTGLFREDNSFFGDENLLTITRGFVLRSTIYPSIRDRFGVSASLRTGIISKNHIEDFSDQTETYKSINISSLAIGPSVNFWNHRRFSLFTGFELGVKRNSRTYIDEWLPSRPTVTRNNYSSIGYFNLAIQIKFYRKEKDGILDMY